jgi:uncharacterized protein YecE (DUF72 family)
MGEVVLGTSGWDYPEWVGRVYPRRGVTDRLRYYSGLFPIVEVNSTFYRLPPVSVAASWARRTPERFRFSAKFPQTITHERRLVGAEAELRKFLQVMAPLRDAGKFIAGLLQLPPSLPFDAKSVRAFYESVPAGFPVAVEFREPSWRSPESMGLLKEFGFAYVVVDEPFLPVDLEVTAPFSYVRWHGRGAQLWYDYTYSEPEIQEWVPKVGLLEEKSTTVYGFFNNHFRGDAAVNAQRLTELLGLPPPPWSSRLGA